ncbi:SAM-dependent methyltransferase [Phormidesmis priestleyi ULC007]|uniref:SAM-dependent methyltransferase n=2 Tax=Phormidesmis priestleyi TaxID=268141 RepID=A0A2T1D600_9CYAN|nr:SAM-dependent methyltransferase [Phormidesmis priestleyi ULC007]PZO53510.1 MAG: SAM-dependent methyltransferase [Phormidesmis priestleyi]
MRLEQVVPWGRSCLEYCQMFDLTETDLQSKILDCGGGPASFNAEMTQQGNSVISCDPLYQFSVNEISQRIDQTYPIVIKTTEVNRDNFVWTTIQSPEKLGQIRMAAMQQFLADFPLGLQQRRYQQESLPDLPFDSQQFDLALCSHFLFLYSDQLSFEFHLASIIEMCRVATIVKIFPLLVNMTGELSPFLEPIMQELTTQGYSIHTKQVPYEFQKGGNQILQVSAKQ